MSRMTSNYLLARAKTGFFDGHKTSVLDELIVKFVSDNQSLIPIIQDFVLSIGIYRDREICRQCPGCCCPNRNADWPVGWQTNLSQLIGRNWKSHVNGGVVALLIFHFGFG